MTFLNQDFNVQCTSNLKNETDDYLRDGNEVEYSMNPAVTMVKGHNHKKIQKTTNRTQIQYYKNTINPPKIYTQKRGGGLNVGHTVTEHVFKYNI